MNIGIVGYGFVGGATAQLSKNIIVYDTDETKRTHEMADLIACDVVFVCVPTPAATDESADISIVRSVVTKLISIGVQKHRIIIRSTCPPGTAKSLGVSCMPEFLTERRAKKDFEENTTWVLGTEFDTTATLMRNLLSRAKEELRILSDNMYVVTPNEAELVKYTKNTFLSIKVSFFNEIYGVCGACEANYETVRKLVAMDARIGSSHTYVPGPDGKFGFGGHCFPKDCKAFCAFSNDDTSLVRTALKRNAVDRSDSKIHPTNTTHR